MKTSPTISLRLAVATFIIPCCFALADQTPSPAVPKLVFTPYQIINGSGEEPHLEIAYLSARDSVHALVKLDSPATRKELNRWIADDKNSMDTRFLYAGILAVWNDLDGQAFLLQRGRSVSEMEDAKDVFWLIGHLDWLRPDYDSTHTVDMHWAEAFMLEILKTPKALKATEQYGGSSSRQELAMYVGNFGEILGRMKSKNLYDVSLVSQY